MALSNLLQNAIQASPPDKVVTLSAERSGTNMVLMVSDEGSGIQPQHLENIFNPFFTTKPQGVGLGLPIVSKIVDEHQGRIEVESGGHNGCPVAAITEANCARTRALARIDGRARESRGLLRRLLGSAEHTLDEALERLLGEPYEARLSRVRLTLGPAGVDPISVRVFDPETRMRTICDMAEQTGRREFVPKTPAKPSVPNPQVHVEDLGTTPLNGLQARGTRRTQTIYGSGYGNGGPIEVVDETWYSPELRLNLLVRHSDPRNGVETVGVSGLKREEPAATLFEAPPGCKIADVEPPPAPAPASSPQPVGVEPPPDPQP